MVDHGFAPALRSIRTRRNRSQPDIAVRVETTQRHISFLERGRSLPGRAMVVLLAESLELPLRERNDLVHAARYAPVFREWSTATALAPVLDALRHILDGHLPYPAIVIDRHGDLVAANAALDVLTEAAAPELCQPGMNVYRLPLHPHGVRPRIANSDEWTRHVQQQLCQQAICNPDPRLDALLAEFAGYPTTPTLPDAPDSLGLAVPLHLGSVHGQLRVITTVTTFATATDITIGELNWKRSYQPTRSPPPHCRAR